MAKEKSEEKEMSKIPYENIRYVQKYGLTRKELEAVVQGDLKFSNSFSVVADYLWQAQISIEENKVKECEDFIERAKYVLRGCKE